MTNQPATTKGALEPCPFCGAEGVPDPVNEGWFAIRHSGICYFTQNGRDITAHHVPTHQNWNSRVSAPIAPVVDLNLRKDEIALLINYNLERLEKAQCDESARNYRKRIERLREFYEN